MAGKNCSEWQLIPVRGNAFITAPEVSTEEIITEDGIENWTSSQTVISVYFWMSHSCEIEVLLRLKVSGSDSSDIKVSLYDSDQSYVIHVVGDDYHDCPVGKFFVSKSGYVRLDLQGVQKKSECYAEVSHVVVRCSSAIKCDFDECYWGRRGPSVHLNYQIPSELPPIQCFYDEVTVPHSFDVLGTYACAIGFDGGYLGLQVNEDPPNAERRILFSIWSQYETDDPSQVPEEYRVQLLKKGETTIINDFGDEGSGAQSYIKYGWESGKVYKFLVTVNPMDSRNTRFSAWFQSPEMTEWQLVACFRKPKVSHYLKSPHSFLENFNKETGWVERKAIFDNQWVQDVTGNWTEITKVLFTGDETSERWRMDFSGGVEDDKFFLRHCGFFSDRVDTGQSFVRPGRNSKPDINVDEMLM